MTYNPNPTPADGTITTAKLGGDVTDAAKALLQASTAKGQRQALDLAETTTQATGAVGL